MIVKLSPLKVGGPGSSIEPVEFQGRSGVFRVKRTRADGLIVVQSINKGLIESFIGKVHVQCISNYAEVFEKRNELRCFI